MNLPYIERLMYHEESIRLKWARFVIKLKHPAPGNSAKEKLRAPVFHEEKNRIMEPPVLGVSVW
jgi:hypothetical protein